MYNLINFVICTRLWNLTTIKTMNMSIITKSFLLPFCNPFFPLLSSALSPTQFSCNHWSTFCHYRLVHFLEFYIHAVFQYVLSFIWHLSPRIIIEIYHVNVRISNHSFSLLSSILVSDVTRFVYLFIYWWIFGLFPVFGFYKWNFCELSYYKFLYGHILLFFLGKYKVIANVFSKGM